MKTTWTFQLPTNYGRFGFKVVLFVLRCFAEFCGRLLVFYVRFALIGGRFVGCADLRVFAQKTGSITKTARICEDPGSWLAIVHFVDAKRSYLYTVD